MKMYDMHCHVDLMSSLTDFSDAAQKANIGILAMTTTPKAYEREVHILEDYPNIRVALGLHPQLITERYSELSLVEKYFEGAPFIGEVGLDFNKQFYRSKDKQLEVFEHIIQWCGLIGKKVVSIHSVHAVALTLDMIEKHSAQQNNSIIFHWFSGSLEQLQRAIDLGCYFSINSTMIQAKSGRDRINAIPRERLLVESDAPFISQIDTVQKLSADLEFTLNWLAKIFGADTHSTIAESSKKILGEVSFT